ncbi:riboflavin synthase [Caryophanon latum]|uniref:Riboflavin synthase n=1 Tax=Caryophanon latum TaxID=33977 RepID=A0A1C0YTF6_9BACL|nr:riboflavin synthase [Caryophanon latum]OCS90440.1 riboflavin synthase subunit alpha [Caryophanon latum]
MFTGIIEEIGQIMSIQATADAIALTIQASKVLEDVQLGDSIAVNGVCLTVTTFTSKSFTADVMPETIDATSLRSLSRGSVVNLERAMAANGRFGGHIVSGHVDGVGTLLRKTPKGNAVYVDIQLPKELAAQCIHKGSICIDGISLTIFNVTDTSVTVSLIPHTYAETILSKKQVGDIVNIECDLFGKYVQHFLAQRQASSNISRDFLTQHGF